jgi:hypothetical protein
LKVALSTIKQTFAHIIALLFFFFTDTVVMLEPEVKKHYSYGVFYSYIGYPMIIERVFPIRPMTTKTEPTTTLLYQCITLATFTISSVLSVFPTPTGIVVFGYPMAYLSVIISIWMTVGVTVDRYILVCWIRYSKVCLLANVYWQMFIGKCLLANVYWQI